MAGPLLEDAIMTDNNKSENGIEPMIDAIVTCYTEAMVEHHEETKFPPVRGMTPTPDPMASPFADLEDDLPWETKP